MKATVTFYIKEKFVGGNIPPFIRRDIIDKEDLDKILDLDIECNGSIIENIEINIIK